MTTNATLSQTDSLHLRIPQDMREQLDHIAASIDRSRNWVVTHAIKEYLEVQRWQVEVIRERLKKAESGKGTVIPHNIVIKRQRKRLMTKLGL